MKLINNLADRIASMVLPEDSAAAATKCYNKPIGNYWWGRCYYNPGCRGNLEQTKYNCMWGPGSSHGNLVILGRRCC
ncbi:hypothetical protein FAF44_18895 [Nonomuraea sp. MG754425]|uniref:hypothetical protein n=1 Tax=Nonomuraea sp. MG754425 TaxID=2570319 RepID=UPI001F318A30|nr:hypothetical protein [Nonomuraea sp. MG754425]MCF6470447.1 hypothetical protein [Nonomuraea sp. MG754425]